MNSYLAGANPAWRSIADHGKLGFEKGAYFREVGWKFGNGSTPDIDSCFRKPSRESVITQEMNDRAGRIGGRVITSAHEIPIS